MITVLQMPQAYTPAYNPQWFKATSSNTGQPNFIYTVVLTDSISGESVTKNIDPDPNGYCVFDAGSFAEQYLTQVNPSGLYGWQINTGALRNISVNIGETYGSPPIYYAGSNNDYIVWNGSLDFLQFQNFNYLNHVYTYSNNIQLITNNHNPNYTWNPSPSPEYYSNDETVTADRSSYLYFISTLYNAPEKISVVGFDNNGNLLGSTVIGNFSVSGTSNYYDLYQFIDLGYDGLNNMPGGQIMSGTYPIPVSTYDYWIVFDESSWLPANPNPFGAPYVYPLKRYNKVCTPRYDVYTIHYLCPEGSFETQPCIKLSLKKSEVTKGYYSKIPYEYSGTGPISYTYGVSVDNVLSSTIKDRIVVNTDWLTETEITQLKDAISAPIIYVDKGDTGGYVAMKMITNTYDEKKKFNEQMLSASFELEYTHVNIRQRD